MKWTILGSGGCMVIPKPLCRCRVCRKARERGIPYSRAGPAAFLHDINLLIDTPADIINPINRSSIRHIEYLTITHPDPDHIEGLRIVEQIALDFRTWHAYPQKQVCLLLPEPLEDGLRNIRSQYGSALDFYRESGFIHLMLFQDTVRIKDVGITAISVDRGSQLSFVYVFEKANKKVVYAPCDIKPFPEHRDEVQQPDLLIIQPGIFEEGLKHGFKYPVHHISRTMLYTFEQTLNLATRTRAKKVLFVHLEEYWNRSYEDYCALEPENSWFRFAYDGMHLEV
ncbi:MBL fold metallo-hydrolase [Chloroflexota bacterium]